MPAVPQRRRGCEEQDWGRPQWSGWPQGRHSRERDVQQRTERVRHHLGRDRFQGIREQPGWQGAGHDDVACGEGPKGTWRPLGLPQTVWPRREEEMTMTRLPDLYFHALVAAVGLVTLIAGRAD